MPRSFATKIPLLKEFQAENIYEPLPSLRLRIRPTRQRGSNVSPRHVCPVATAADHAERAQSYDFFAAPGRRSHHRRAGAAVVARGEMERHQRRRHARQQKGTAGGAVAGVDRKSTRLNSSHSSNSYAVFCLKKKIQGYYSTYKNYLTAPS